MISTALRKGGKSCDAIFVDTEGTEVTNWVGSYISGVNSADSAFPVIPKRAQISWN